MSAILLPNYEQAEAYTSGDSTIHIRGHVLCDTAADLPATTFFTGFTLDAGSTARDIATAARYMLNSSGAWILQRSADISALVSDISALETQLQSTSADATYAKTQIDTIIKPALAAAINNGAKNRLKLTPTSNTYTSNGITAVYNDNTGLVTLSGQHISTDATFVYNMYAGSIAAQYTINAGTYTLSGMPSGGTTSTYRAILRNISAAVDNGSGAEISISGSEPIAYSILISGNVDFSNPVTVYPMLCDSRIYKFSADFAPYAPTNRELYLMMQ